jgi:hypothetical protein
MPSDKQPRKPIFGAPATDDPDDAPELLEEFFRTAEWTIGDKVIRPGQPPITDTPVRGDK